MSICLKVWNAREVCIVSSKIHSLSADQQKVFSCSVVYRCPSLLQCSAFIDLNVLLGKRAISNLRGTASPLKFTAGCAKKPMFKPKISICLKSVYVTGEEKKERKM